MSWRIFMHSVRQVFGNLEGALRVSALLTVVQVLASLASGPGFGMTQAQLQEQIAQGNFAVGPALVSGLIVTFTSLWIAVGWHRYVLTNEVPVLMPTLHFDRILGYFGKSFLMVLVCLPLAFLAIVAVLLVVGPAQLQGGSVGQQMLLGLIIYLPIGIVFTRLGTALPGVALRAGVPLFSGWEATRGQTGAVAGVVVLTLAMGIGLGAPGSLMVQNGLVLPGIIWGIVVQWISVMVGVSVLTTLYGHYVEGRPLV
ncbi:MAG: hypothetical protein MUD11_09000 [Rhodobacteraceae bacterium]|jgi:hypothetical protein|nr:hypothetical protein [Paracoccaceae bacterium]